MIAAYIEELTQSHAAPTMKQHLVEIRMLLHGRNRLLTENRLTSTDVLRIAKRRWKVIGLSPHDICCHTWRVTGITAFLENGGTLERAHQSAAHEPARTAKLYDRTDNVSSGMM